MNKLAFFSTSAAALALSAVTAFAQVPVQQDGGDPTRQQRRLERQMERSGERMDQGGMRRQDMQQGERDGFRTGRAERREFNQDDEERTGSTLRMERAQSRERDREIIVRDRDRDRDRGPNFRFGVGPDVFVRTLAPTYRYVVVGGERCRITITRRVNRNGRIVTSERQRCPGRPEVVIQTRR